MEKKESSSSVSRSAIHSTQHFTQEAFRRRLSSFLFGCKFPTRTESMAVVSLLRAGSLFFCILAHSYEYIGFSLNKKLPNHLSTIRFIACVCVCPLILFEALCEETLISSRTSASTQPTPSVLHSTFFPIHTLNRVHAPSLLRLRLLRSPHPHSRRPTTAQLRSRRNRRPSRRRSSRGRRSCSFRLPARQVPCLSLRQEVGFESGCGGCVWIEFFFGSG